MKILVTGGAGFIGSHLCKKLIELEHEVYCVDNFYTGSLSNIKNLVNNPKFFFNEFDVRSSEFKDYFVKQNIIPDQIYNLACPASPVHYQTNPTYTFMTSVVGTINVLSVASLNKNCRVIQASTSEVYGDPEVHPQPEEYWGNVNPIGLRSCYDEGKRAAETILMDHYRQFGIDVGIARIFNTYGPNMQINDGRVVSNFIVQALENKNITIYGDGSQTRSFQYVDDLIDGLIALMNSKEKEPVNLGNPVEFTMNELAEIVLKLTKSKSMVEYKKLPSDDPKQRKPNIDKAKRVLNWEPSVKLNDGLIKTIKYFDGRLSEK